MNSNIQKSGYNVIREKKWLIQVHLPPSSSSSSSSFSSTFSLSYQIRCHVTIFQRLLIVILTEQNLHGVHITTQLFHSKSISFNIHRLLPQLHIILQVNCLSSEFTQKKHGTQEETAINYNIINYISGGEKGVLLRLIITHNEGIEDGNSVVIYRAFCLIKVFKVSYGNRLFVAMVSIPLPIQDKGADRKHRQDILRREKLPPQEAVSF